MFGDRIDPVEAGVAGNARVIDTYIIKQFGGLVVLCEEMCHVTELSPEPDAPRLEKILVRSQ